MLLPHPSPRYTSRSTPTATRRSASTSKTGRLLPGRQSRCELCSQPRYIGIRGAPDKALYAQLRLQRDRRAEVAHQQRRRSCPLAGNRLLLGRRLRLVRLHISKTLLFLLITHDRPVVGDFSHVKIQVCADKDPLQHWFYTNDNRIALKDQRAYPACCARRIELTSCVSYSPRSMPRPAERGHDERDADPDVPLHRGEYKPDLDDNSAHSPIGISRSRHASIPCSGGQVRLLRLNK